MSEIRTKIEAMPLWMKVLLCIFSGGLFGGVYRFCSGTQQGMFVGFLWPVINGVLCGIPSLIDLITCCTNGKPTVITE